MDDYDVFLNHRGPDVKGGFIAHLEDALRSNGLNPFLDKKSLVKGDPAFRSIDDALQSAKILVAVVSKGYVESKYCLNELVAMIRSGKPVIPVFYDVEPAHLRWVKKGPFVAAFEKHKNREPLEVLVEWEQALQKLSNISGFCFRLSDYKGDEAELKREVVDAVMKLMPVDEVLQVEHYTVGCEEPLRRCIHELEKMQGDIGFLCLVGMGGIGKTTLAKLIYNRMVGEKKFKSVSFLGFDSSSPSDIEVGPSLMSRLQKKLLWDLLHVPNNTSQSYKYWFHKLSSQGPILIVLDNLLDKCEFEELILDSRLLAQGSRIIVTSRDRHLLRIIAGRSNTYFHEVTMLGCNDSEKLFNWHAFHQEEVPKNFKVLAHDVSKACGGLPLALKVVGSSLFGMTSNEDQECIWPEAIDALKGDPNIMNALKWSYNRLRQSERLMFLDIACIFCGWTKEQVIEIWNSCKKCSSCCGSRTPHISLRHLIDKSLVVIDESRVLVMHGLLRDMGQEIGRANGSHLWEDGTTQAIVAKSQGTNNVRAINFANGQKRSFGAENFAEMQNLHFLIMNGCEVSGDLKSISKELRCLQWRYMPSVQLSVQLDLSNLVSLDFSDSSKLANLWTESNPWMEACPNLLSLNLRNCTSITELPDSIKHLSQLKYLDLFFCENLQKLPTSIGQLTTLKIFFLGGCRRIKVLPDTISALPNLITLNAADCSVISKKQFGLMTRIMNLVIDSATEWQSISVGQFNALKYLSLKNFTDEIATSLDSLGTLGSLDQLIEYSIFKSPSMTNLPKTIGLLTNLEYLDIYACGKLLEIPNSIGQLKVLKAMRLYSCRSLETLPDSLGALRNLQVLIIIECISISKLPNSMKQLNTLELLHVEDCGSLENLSALTTLHGLRIWGCTSIKELLGSNLTVMGIHYICDLQGFHHFRGESYARIREIVDGFRYAWKESRVLEENDCGSLRVHEGNQNGELYLLRIHKLPCEV